MSWKVFAGEHSDLLAALIYQRIVADGISDTSDCRSDCIRAHLARGLDYLASGNETKSIGSFLGRWTELSVKT